MTSIFEMQCSKIATFEFVFSYIAFFVFSVWEKMLILIRKVVLSKKRKSGERCGGVELAITLPLLCVLSRLGSDPAVVSSFFLFAFFMSAYEILIT